MFVAGYDNAHLAFFSFANQKLTHFAQLGMSDNETVSCIAAHEYQTTVVCGLSYKKPIEPKSGYYFLSIQVYDYKSQQVLKELKQYEDIHSLTFLNNSLHLLAATQDGKLKLYETKGDMKQISELETSHLQNQECSINAVLSLTHKDVNSREDEDSAENLPFFISCGADGTIKVFEHNLYEEPD
jgi:WD40 repeat protein